MTVADARQIIASMIRPAGAHVASRPEPSLGALDGGQGALYNPSSRWGEGTPHAFVPVFTLSAENN